MESGLTVKFDLHNHRSSMKKGFFEKVMNTANEKLGAGGILGLVNFSDERYERFTELSDNYEFVEEDGGALYSPEKDIYVMKGQEIPTKRGHLLVMGAGKGIHLKEGRSLEYTLDEAREQDLITIADHPFYAEGIGSYLMEHPLLLKKISAVEVHNGEAAFGLPIGPFPMGANSAAEKFFYQARFSNPNLGAICSSDGHSLREVGGSYSIGVCPFEIPMNGFKSVVKEMVKKARPEDSKKVNAYCGAIEHIGKLGYHRVKDRIKERFGKDQSKKLS